MNVSHKMNKLQNRLKRLKKKASEVGTDRQGLMVGRMKEIEEILRKNNG